MQQEAMAKIQLSRSQNKTYLQLPEEFGEINEIEMFKLKDGYYIITLPLNQSTQVEEKHHKHKSGDLSEEEISTLRRLVAIRFVDRVPNYVEKVLNQKEKDTLKILERKNLINVFKGNKYKDGVYNISDKAYALITQNVPNNNENSEIVQPILTTTPPTARQEPTINSQSAIALLKSQGFVVINDRNEAYNVAQNVSSEMKRGEVVGIKGFDGKFYAVTKDYLQKGRDAIIRCLKEDMPTASIATEAKLDQNGTTAILRLMAEAGDVIEKRKGVFALV